MKRLRRIRNGVVFFMAKTLLSQGMIRTIAWKLRDQGISFLRSTSISMISLNHNSKSFVPGSEKVGALPTMARLLVVSYQLFVVVNGHEGSSQNIGNTFMPPLSARAEMRD